MIFQEDFNIVVGIELALKNLLDIQGKEKTEINKVYIEHKQLLKSKPSLVCENRVMLINVIDVASFIT